MPFGKRPTTRGWRRAVIHSVGTSAREADVRDGGIATLDEDGSVVGLAEDGDGSILSE